MQINLMISVLQDKYMKKNIRKIIYGGGCTFLAKPLFGLVDAVARWGRRRPRQERRFGRG